MRMLAARPLAHSSAHSATHFSGRPIVRPLAGLLAGLLFVLVLSGCAGIKYTDQPTSHVDLTEPGSPPEAATRVLAKAGEWRNSGVMLRRGASYAVSAAGSWRVGVVCPPTDVDGVGMYGGLCIDWGNAMLKGWNHQALIARVGEKGAPFGVGKSLRFTAPDDGILYFIINDTPGTYGDNEGYADVVVRALPAGETLAAAPLQPPAADARVAAAEAKLAAKKKAMSSAAAMQAAPAPAPAAEPVQAAAVPERVPAPAQPPAAQAARPGLRRVALVIGNGSYPSAPLKNPVNDARDMGRELHALGFEVILRENASLRQMEDAVDELWTRLKGGGAGLFFFAGHGLQVGGRNYLVPVDARLSAEQDVKYRCMDAGLVLGRMENAGNQLNIVILDACRNNPYQRSFRSAQEGLAKMDAPKGSLVAYATAPDSVAADGSGKNGIYTGLLLKHLRTPGLGIEELFKRVRIDVLAATGEKQVPWESSSLTGYFTFNEGR